MDKRFLSERLGDDTGWLYKKSGGVNDGLETNELGGGDNPLDDYFCFRDSGNGCPAPSSEARSSELPARLDIAQFLRFGAVNALMGNADGPLFKDNNYYFYDYASGPRVYIPWDLDTAMKDSASVYAGGGGAATAPALMACCSHTGAMSTQPFWTSCSTTASRQPRFRPSSTACLPLPERRSMQIST